MIKGMLRVGINGYGTIGRRVAHAVSLQDDMTVSGIVKTKPDYIAKLASKYYNIYVPKESDMKLFEDAGIKVKGDISKLIDDSELIVDSTPEGMGEKNIEMYKERKIPAIFQGGEEHEIVEASFNSYSNFDQSIGKKYVRVVSCNTTALARTITPIHEILGVRRVNATLIRRATDQNDSTKGPINAVEPSLKFPSHHAPDLKTVLPIRDVETVAVKVPTTLMHVHVIELITDKDAKPNQIIDAWKSRRRITLISGKDGRSSTAQIMDMAREVDRDRSDLYEIPIWRESVYVSGSTIRYIQAVHQESDVVPENIDAIRSMMEILPKEESIEKTDRSMEINGSAF
jgi:glyceraldehyde-3-phosphate dehydrogenase (NAD(P))